MSIRSVRSWQGVALSLAVLMLGACGFQLQGRQMLPASLSVLRIDAVDEQSEFAHALRVVLGASGGRMAAADDSSAAQVRIARDELTERVLSVSSRNIPTDYELIYEVEVSASAGGRELMPREEFSLSRVYSFDETRLLAKEREKQILKEALARDMASVVARRLASL
jgi:LPS-assembly lipoprotein